MSDIIYLDGTNIDSYFRAAYDLLGRCSENERSLIQQWAGELLATFGVISDELERKDPDITNPDKHLKRLQNAAEHGAMLLLAAFTISCRIERKRKAGVS